MSTYTINNQMEALEATFRELDTLSCVQKPSDQQKNRISFLLAQQSMLRQGVSEHAIKRAHLARLKREIGMAEDANIDNIRISNPAMLSEWRNMLKRDTWGHPIGEFKCDPEFRSVDSQGNSEGLMSIAYSQGLLGGTFVPMEYDGRLFQSLAQYDEALDSANCNVVQTTTGRAMQTPAIDDTVGSPATMQQAYIVNENTETNVQAIKAGNVSWQDTPKFHSGIVRVSRELFADTFEPVAAILEKCFALRFALSFGYYVVQGNGVGEPTGFVPSLPAGTVTTSASSTLALTDFENVYSDLPQIYRKGAKWFMNDTTRGLVTKLLETAGRPMVGPAEQLLGKQIVICPSMAPAATATPAVAVLAHPGYLLQRRVVGSAIQTLGQRYAEFGEIGLQAFSRFDSQPMLFNSAFPPVASLNNK